ncbi:MAG: hypothetical protein MUF38_09330 [Anaerolineae bacterium]|nr:hypothetical protein [Anaerolineae bacterium]
MPKKLMLFDDFDRVQIDPSGYSESHWSFINRTAKPTFHYLRTVLENWFDNYQTTEDKRNQLCTNFRSERDSEHLSAFFELYIYTLFKNLDFSVEVEPNWSQNKPDFLVTSPTGERFLLEVTGVYPERTFGETNNLVNKVLDYLNKNLSSPDFFVSIEIHQLPNNLPSYTKICRFLQKQLDELNYDDIISTVDFNSVNLLDMYPRANWEDEKWSIEFILN